MATLGLGRWAIHGRAAWSGLPAEFDRSKVETVRAASGYLSLSWSAVALPAGLVLAPEALVGGAVALERDEAGLRAQLARRVTAGAGLRASSRSVTVAAYAGQHHALRGLAGGVRWSWRIGGSEAGEAGELRSTGHAACDRQACVAETALAVRLR